MRIPLTVTLATLLTLAGARAEGYDLDGDGVVTPGELAARLWNRFAEMDLDGNRTLDPAEQDAGLADAALARELWDADGNGSLSSIEWESAVSMTTEVEMQMCDTDKDGALTGTEIDCLNLE